MSRIKVLLVVTEFWQAGCQKFNYEIDKWLNKSIFQTQIICFHDLNSNPDWDDFYYEKHKKLGTPIKFLSDFKIQYGFFQKKVGFDKDAIKDYFDQFDKVIFQGEYCWKGFSNFVPYNKNKFFISIHNSLLQDSNNYAGYDKSLEYNFITSFTKFQSDFEFKEFKRINYFYYPLSISAKWQFEWEIEFINSKKIGLFTRFTKGKPIFPFLYAFQKLVEVDSEFRLCIYGNGEPEIEEFMEHIQLLNIGENIDFKGHSTNIVESAVNDKLSIVFAHSYHCVPGGFASFQLSSAGIPQLFFEMIPQKNFYFQDKGFFFTNSIAALSYKAIELLNDPKIAKLIAVSQFDENKRVRDVSKNILLLEECLV
jgi:glycosyltransferase involved in cell wall biosynthesis